MRVVRELELRLDRLLTSSKPGEKFSVALIDGHFPGLGLGLYLGAP